MAGVYGEVVSIRTVLQVQFCSVTQEPPVGHWPASCPDFCVLLSTTNKMQRYTIFFITVNALHVSGLLVAASKLDIYQMLCVQF
jgi:hypothetical protein